MVPPRLCADASKASDSDRPGVLFGCSDHCWKRLICLHLSAEVAIAKNVHVWLSTTLLATSRAAVVADPMAFDGTSQL